jgi:AcrR family transcriptional regulator
VTPPGSAQRADATRNRANLLAAAAEEFAVRGADASVAAIARRAGVAKGTVFAHFPTKEDLLAAIVVERVEAIADLGTRLMDAADPGVAILEFITAAGDQRQHQALSFLRGAGDLTATMQEASRRMYRVADDLVARARTHGALRQDVTGSDVILLMCAPNFIVNFAKDPSDDLWRRYLAIIFIGLSTETATALPAPPADLP